VHPDLNHIYDEVGPLERSPQVWVFLDPGIGADPRSTGHHASGLEPFGVGVVHGDRGSSQLGEAERIG
jgi:hypothetical protein